MTWSPVFVGATKQAKQTRAVCGNMENEAPLSSHSSSASVLKFSSLSKSSNDGSRYGLVWRLVDGTRHLAQIQPRNGSFVEFWRKTRAENCLLPSASVSFEISRKPDVLG